MTLCEELSLPSIEKDVIFTNSPNDTSESDESQEPVSDPFVFKRGEWRREKGFILLLLCCLSFSFTMGYQMLAVSGYLLLKKDLPPANYWKELLVGVTSGAAMFGSIFCGQLSDSIGRKKTILMSGALHIVGSILQTIGIYHTLPGRILVCLAFGLSSVVVPVYLAESSPTKKRGYVMILNQASLILGLSSSVILAAAFSYIKYDSWRYLMGFALIPSVLQFWGFIWLPESPRYLQKKKENARMQKEMSSILPAPSTKEIKFKDDTDVLHNASLYYIWKKILLTPCVRRALIICCSLHIVAQLSGINVIMFYSGIFLKSQIEDHSIALWLSCIPIITNFLFTFVGLYLIERIGRRKLLFLSTAGVITTLLFLGVVYWIIEHKSYPVTLQENVIDSPHCKKYMSCLDCVSDQECGFCYVKEPTVGVINGSCVSVSQHKTHLAAGRCNASADNISPEESPLYILANNVCPSNLIFWILIGQVLYIACFASGLGSLPWIICAEVYPMWARSQCGSMVVGVMWLFSWLLTGSFLTLSKQITSYGSYFLMALFTLVGLIFWYVYLPETKGKKLEETAQLFSKPFCFCCKNYKKNELL